MSKRRFVNINSGIGGIGDTGFRGSASGRTAFSPFGGSITGKDARAFRMWGGSPDGPERFQGATNSAAFFSDKAFGAGGSFNASSAAALIKKIGGTDEEGAHARRYCHSGIQRSRDGAQPANRRTGDDSLDAGKVNMIDKLGPERLKKFGLSAILTFRS